ncbi:hypothetical protein BATDEDRAFT_25429 [Batrachochytrium dendrobatidis JAM81]|uniref:Methyltransferase domain-containing protein n=2 Tax=Batrachochytrium dendrobatidis TaxID=109871 RepID=F4P4G6_BATDJ|nr:uncharacterized protein BATDEDRAFT_25429 [Batrachochytrium dendrobatidis JAM81]EGF79706.1 hypothetical protein BATDEDRAFT_25429 [Batrachochytrium dendrobatidis JAM81]KAJ8323334.1 hypothetical protein O5D80_008091 [Batrachochytrium dendrobatidis]KAK5673039.1 hypothetical protein QVD99_000512 [Batrachochytrium dendrobatidis]OAJ38825.1 hypothetical protein BDEG_22725 [Batrachochytrium dendrobatidis JEL423]|eukprot:XP_006679451.1 hypothetical protein BATDEDRAFT_25429 [Batrachochytrium dendrobatidis JAM81]
MSMLDVLPENNESYGTQDYWEDRYVHEEQTTFDWFKGFDDIQDTFTKVLVNKTGRILHLGCGNSRLGEDLYKAGWTHIVNVDYSPAVIDTMTKRCSELLGMTWDVADVFKLDQVYPAQSFEYAIDKGTLDALLTRKHDPWNPPPDLCQDISNYISQVSRMLSSGGILLHITFAQPHFRKRFLEIPEFKVSTLTLEGKGGGFEYFAYVCQKI